MHCTLLHFGVAKYIQEPCYDSCSGKKRWKGSWEQELYVGLPNGREKCRQSSVNPLVEAYFAWVKEKEQMGESLRRARQEED